MKFIRFASIALAAGFVAALVAGCASPQSSANDLTVPPHAADARAYPLRAPRLSVGTSYPDTQLILPWFLNDIIDFVNYR